MKQPIEQRLDPGDLTEMRLQGLSYRKIAQVTGLSYKALCAYGKRALPPDLRQLHHRRAQARAFYARLEALDDGTRTGYEIAEIVGCNPVTVYRARTKRNEEPPDPDLPRCTRCKFPGDPPRNPLLDTGRCLWCELTVRGVNPAHFCETVKVTDIPLYVNLIHTLPPPDTESEPSQCHPS